MHDSAVCSVAVWLKGWAAPWPVCHPRARSAIALALGVVTLGAWGAGHLKLPKASFARGGFRRPTGGWEKSWSSKRPASSKP